MVCRRLKPSPNTDVERNGALLILAPLNADLPPKCIPCTDGWQPTISRVRPSRGRKGGLKKTDVEKRGGQMQTFMAEREGFEPSVPL